MTIVKWKLKEYLEGQNLSVYQLWKATGLSKTGTYKIVNNQVKGLEFDALGRIISALEKLTGRTVEPNDVLEVVRNG